MKVPVYEVYDKEDVGLALEKVCEKQFHKVLNSAENVTEMMNELFNFQYLSEEKMYLIALNARMEVKGVFLIGMGGVNFCYTSAGNIFKRLLLVNSSHFIIVHNHPGGSIYPSIDDDSFTKKVKDCSKLMDINLLDHIIIGNGYYSYAEQKKIAA